MNKNRLPMIIILTDGIALSNSSKGNAVFAANPSNLTALWNNYPSMTIDVDPSFGKIVNNDASVAELLMGRPVPSNHSLAEDNIARLAENKTAKEAINYVSKHNSALHLIGHLPSGKNSKISHLEAILKMAKENNIYNVYLHFIIDKNEECKAKILEIESILKKNVGEILSLCGSENIRIEADNLANANKFINCLALSKAKYFANSEQAVQSNWNRSGDFPPCILVNNKKPIAQISDFDSLICFDYEGADLLPALWLLKNEYSKARKFLNISTLVQSDEFPEIEGFFVPERDANLCRLFAKKDLKQTFIADNISLFILKKLADKENAVTKMISIGGYDSKAISDYFYRLASCINNHINKSDIVVADSGLIAEIAKKGTLAQVASAVKILDQFVGTVVEKVLISGGTLVLASCFGGAEKVNIDTGPHPTYFILVSNLIRKTTPFFKKPVLKESLIPSFSAKKHYLFDATATILDIIGIDKPEFCKGKSFVEELIKKEYVYES